MWREQPTITCCKKMVIVGGTVPSSDLSRSSRTPHTNLCDLALSSLRSLCNYGGFVTKVKKAPKPRAMRYANSSVVWFTTTDSSINYTRASVGLFTEVHSRYVFWDDNALPLGPQKALLSLCLYNYFYGA